MAKGNRFPSPANVQMNKGKPVVRPVTPEPEKTFEGKKPNLIQVHSYLKNTVVLPNGVHSIAPGLNHIGKEEFESASSHPSIAKHIKDGSITIESKGSKIEPKSEPKAEAQDSTDEDNESA